MRPNRFLALFGAACLLLFTTAAAAATTPTVPDWWEVRSHVPFETADGGVVAWGGKLFVLGGYLSDGKVGIYSPGRDSWKSGATQPSTAYSFPSDACVGRDAGGLPVAILFPEALGFTMHRYYLEEDRWDEQDLPAGLPHQLYLQDVVSMLPLTGENVCYISGGRDTTVSPNTNVSSLLKYFPATNTVQDLGDFTYSPNGFEWHSSWYAPWIGSGGAVCAAGGLYLGYSGGYTFTPVDDTQCYDLAGGYFRTVNADLGQLPQPMAQGADMQRELFGGVHELWLVGTASGLTPVAYVWNSEVGSWRPGPAPPRAVFRQEGDSLDGELHVIGGVLGEDHHQVIRKPRLTMLYPNGGEVITSDSTYEVRWAPPAGAVSFRLTYSTDGGLTWRPLADGLTSASHTWQVPAWVRAKKRCLVKVEAFNALRKRIGSDRSNGRFTVAPPTP